MNATSVWLQPPRPRRAAPLTLDRIVTAAVAVLDEHGIPGLTMRRLASGLDVTSTALYWHVRTKDDLLDLAVDEVFGEVPLPAGGSTGGPVRDSVHGPTGDPVHRPTGDTAGDPVRGPAGDTAGGSDWAEDVRALMRGWRAAMLRHPWAPGLIGRPMLGPNVLARTEFLQSALVRGGFSGVGLAVVTRLLANFVIGAAVTEATWQQAPDPGAARRHIEAAPSAYPTLIASGHLDEGLWNNDDLFDQGVAAILAMPLRG